MSTRYAPLVVVLGVHLIAAALFFGNVGVQYPSGNRAVVAVYLLLNAVAAMVGYQVGARIRPRQAAPLSVKVPILGLIATAVIFIPEVGTYTGGSLDQFVTFLADPAQAYSLMAEQVARGRSERMGIIVVKSLVSPLTVTITPCLGFLYFRYRKHGSLLILSIGLTLVMSVFRGTDKEIFDVAILLSLAWLMAKAHRASEDGLERFRLLSLRGFLLASTMGVALVAVFSFRKSERLAGAQYACIRNTLLCQEIDAGNPLSTGFGLLGRYLSQGFYGLSVAMDAQPTVAGTGVGHSRPLQYLLQQYLDVESSTGVTGQLTGLGWTSEGAWSTGYVWLANDVTLYGVPLVIFVMALLFGASWRQAIYMPTVSSIVTASYLFYAFVYMIGNLQIAQSGPVYLGVLVWATVYILGRRRSY